jgi:hypothetical protein
LRPGRAVWAQIKAVALVGQGLRRGANIQFLDLQAFSFLRISANSTYD